MQPAHSGERVTKGATMSAKLSLVLVVHRT